MSELDDTAASSRSMWRARLAGFGPSDLAALGVCGLLVVLFAPPLTFESWTLRAAVVVALVPFALVALARLCRARDLAAIALAAALLAALVSSLASGAVRATLLGVVGRDLSLLVLVGSAGAWCLGRATSRFGSSSLEGMLIAATCVSASVGLLQVLFDVETGDLAMLAGRPTGLTSNPVYFGAVSGAGLVTLVARRSVRRAVLVGGALLLGTATAWSASRVAIVAAVVVIVAIAAIRRERAATVQAAVGFGALVVGVLLDRVIGVGSDSADRLLEDSGAGRTSVWRWGMSAWTDRPLFGYGPGRFRAAVQDRFTADFVRVNAPDDLRQAWFDAHNVLVNLLVSVGIVTVLLLLAWVVLWARRIRGPLAAAVVVIALTWMLQPASLYTLPLVALLFGAAGRADPPVDEHDGADAPGTARRFQVLAAAVGAVAALWLVVADVRLSVAVDAVDAGAAEDAAAMYGDDPVVADVVAQVHAFGVPPGVVTDGELAWRIAATRAEPDRPYWWAELAESQLGVDDLDGAAASVEQGLALQHYNVRTLRVAAQTALVTRDVERLEAVLVDLCLVDESVCEMSAAELIATRP